MTAGASGLSGKRVAIVVAPSDFRDEELSEPRRHLQRLGVSVVVACVSLEVATGMLGATVQPDMLIADVMPEDFDGIVFVGGGGARAYFSDEAVLELARRFCGTGKVVGGICIAPSILANAGVLAGKRATSFESERGVLAASGASVDGEPVVVDDNIVTAEGPAAAAQFAQALGDALCSVHESAEE